MNKMLVTVFDTEDGAYKGLDALLDLDDQADITLYATAVLTKYPDGTVEVKQEASEGPIGTGVGILTGALVGLIAGPAGAAVSAATGAAVGGAVGGLTGLAVDAGRAGVNVDFLDEVSDLLIPGKTVLLAEVDEDEVAPVDTRMAELGGLVFRRPRSEVLEDQLNRDSYVLNQEAKEIQDEIQEETGENKAAAEKTLQSVKQRLEAIKTKADEKRQQVNGEAKAKVQKLETKLNQARDEQRAKIDKRITEIKADQKRRSEKLQQASESARQALTL